MHNIFGKYKNLSIAVLGDYYLDEYLWIDAELNEPSLETGLVAYQCTKREAYPGAAGTIAKNLVNLGVGTVYAVGYVGDDGRGLEMCRRLDSLGVNRDNIVTVKGRCTPTHTKPWIVKDGKTQELSRIDIKNWTKTPAELEDAVLTKLKGIIGNIDALIILDHTAEEGCGIITAKVREALAKIAKDNPNCITYADSRGRIGLFDGMMLKGNQFELCHAIFGSGSDSIGVQLAADPSIVRTQDDITEACQALYQKTGKPVICTVGEDGVQIHSDTVLAVPGIKTEGQLDVCGAGDMFTSAFISALAAGADMQHAAKIGNAAAAICVQQLGTSGHVTVDDITTVV